MSAPLPFTSCWEVVERSRFDPPAEVEPFTGYTVTEWSRFDSEAPYPPEDVRATLDASDVEAWEDDELGRLEAEGQDRIRDEQLDEVNR